METFNLDSIQTTPGQTSYKPLSTDVNSIVLICLITEGAKEEKKYFQYIKEQLLQHPDLNFNLVIINDNLKGGEKHKSNPISRYNQLQDWRKQNISAEGMMNVHDESWLVCDRDAESFTDEQFEMLLLKTKEEGLHLVVSNPAFQIWLLFHYEQNIDNLNLNDNISCHEKIQRIEDLLKSINDHYSHGNLKMYMFSNHIMDAVYNSEQYPTSLEELKTLVGTNFATIIRRIMPWLFAE